MPLLCPRCKHANPPDAVYCHFDGVVLNQPSFPAPAAAVGFLPQEFVFPSNRRCTTWDELVQGCQQEWETARDLLQRDEFAAFFTRIGRLDLAQSARDAKQQLDPDIALHEFIAALPASKTQGPRLDIEPRRLLIGPILAGSTGTSHLVVVNQGKGLLQGKLTVSEGTTWLKVGTDSSGDTVALKTSRSQQIELRVATDGLTADQSYSARLTVVTNGGVVDVPVRLDVQPIVFDRPPFQGSSSPRELAERMRAVPKGAVTLLESGEVARWFRDNNWTYPVPGATARGVASVQQFFEHMGLSRPPAVALSEATLRLGLNGDALVPGQLILQTTARKWVYAEATCAAPWLHLTAPTVSGPQLAVLSFTVDPALLPRGRQHETTINIVANGGQSLAARIVVASAGRRPSRVWSWLFD